MTVAGDVLARFQRERPRLFGLAYRMLGSAQDAEDVLQEAWLRWSGAAPDAVRSDAAWLTTVVARLCLTRLTSARARREVYPGPWLPEPVPTGASAADPQQAAELRDSVSLALLVTLERLGPAERAVYVLREAFDYSYREIAQVLDLTEPHCRQLHRRAVRHLGEPAGSPAPEPAGWTQLVQRFLAAAQNGDLPGLEALLAADVTATADGGGRVHAARRPVHGRERVAHYLAGVLGHPRAAAVRRTAAEVNGAPALLGWVGDRLIGAVVLDVVDRGGTAEVVAVRFLANPDKLGYLAAGLRAGARPAPSRSAGPSRLS